MKTMCFIVDMFEAYFQVKEIKEKFPCFVIPNKLTDTYCEVTIKCREEDAKAIEDILADVV